MQLRDQVELWGPTGASGGEDAHGNPLPPPTGKLATVPAQVYYSTAGLNFNDGYGRMVAVEQLRAIINPTTVDLQADVHWVVWRGDEYRIDGVLDRSARGSTHHMTLELSVRT